jgi:pimeloyl-ACP methyl ester carboxylesterase
MFAKSGAASLAYDVDGAPGEGADLLLIHAGVTDRRSWRPLVAAIGDGRRIVSYDQRGYGDTTYTPEPYDGHPDALAVMDAAGLEAPVVVGASMGGKVSLHLALEHPERVSALVLIGPAVSGAPEPAPYPEPLASMEKAQEAAWERGDFEEVNRLDAHIWLDGPTAPEGRVGGELRDLFLEMNQRALNAEDPGDPPGSMDAWSRLEELAMPILVLVGALDLPEIQANCRAIAERAKDARFVELPGVAHLPHFEADPACFEAISTFLDGLPTR